MFGIEKPLPNPSEDTEPYWAACARGELPIARCGGCGHVFLPPASWCPCCWSAAVTLVAASGRAALHSFILVHRPQHPAFFADAPYNVAIVRLDEGPLMHTRIVGVAPADLVIGMPLEVFFEKVADEIFLPMFKKRSE
jgi:uncharacterized OB-fold protein